jgi:predicted DNA-binding ribbon-helix-helix protein
MPRPLVKRSIAIAGHRTSVALEPEFWAVIEAMARENGQSLPGLLEAIDGRRGERPLASALRVAALMWQGRGSTGIRHPGAVACDGPCDH